MQAAGSRGFTEFSGIKSANAVTFGKRSDDFASVVAAQSAVVGYHSWLLLLFVIPWYTFDDSTLTQLHLCMLMFATYSTNGIRIAVQSASSGASRAVTEAKIKVAINGFGRIGRNFIRCWHGRKDSPLEVVVINDTGGLKQASHLLKYDSMLGTFNADVKVVGDDAISVDGKVIKVVSDRNPLNLPWGYVCKPFLCFPQLHVLLDNRRQ